MLFRLIAAEWALESGNITPSNKVVEGDFDIGVLQEYNQKGYNCFFFPNYPSDYSLIPNHLTLPGRKRWVLAEDINTFEFCFVDLDMKDYQSTDPNRSHNYATKQAFIDALLACPIVPTSIVDSGGGVHAYWRVTNLDVNSYLRLNRRLCRKFSTDPATCLINQLMRVPGTLNVKRKDDFRPCEVVYSSGKEYDSEMLNSSLPPITPEDEEYCVHAYNTAYNREDIASRVTEEIPNSFLKLCRLNPAISKLFYENNDDRSAADYRLGHLMFEHGIPREDAIAVLCNTLKASTRHKHHRMTYAESIVSKIWVKENKVSSDAPKSIKDILAAQGDDDTCERFPCHPIIDATKYGFRLTKVLGLIGGSGNGKSYASFNMMAWFTEYNANKDYIHLYVTLESTAEEMADIWRTLSAQLKSEQPNVDWDSKVYLLGNYNEDGTYRELGLKEVKEHIIKLEKSTGKKVGCVVIDHIGIVKQTQGRGEFDGLIGNCRQMKACAIATNTFWIIQSQTSRAKNSGGDIELDMDAAYGTSNFEFYCDYVMTIWQPLKRVYDRAPHMTVLAFKMAKIRRKSVLEDKIKADVTYGLMFDPKTGRLREMTSDEHTAFEFYNKQAIQLRNKDRKREPAPMKIINWTGK